MKLIIGVLTLFLVFILRSQTAPLSMYDGEYRGETMKGKKELVYMRMQLVDSIYFINYEIRYPEINPLTKIYIGTFSINSKGILHLKGKHPFKDNDFLLFDTIMGCNEQEVKSGYTRKLEISFNAKIQDSLSIKRRHKIKFLRVLFNKDEYPKIWGYEGCCLPELYRPRESYVIYDQKTRDSVFNSQLHGAKRCNILPKEECVFRRDPLTEDRLFQVDYIRFDTLFINKMLCKRRNDWCFLVDTLCLEQTLKVRRADTLLFLPENTLLFESPTSESNLLYNRGETDLIDKIKMVDYYKDPADVEWVKVEISVRIYDEEAEEDVTDPYIHKEMVGWILQKFIY